MKAELYWLKKSLPISSLMTGDALTLDEQCPAFAGKLANELAAGEPFEDHNVDNPVLFHGNLLYFTRNIQLGERRNCLLSTNVRSGSTAVIIDYQKNFLSLPDSRLVFDTNTDQVYVYTHSTTPGHNEYEKIIVRISLDDIGNLIHVQEIYQKSTDYAWFFRALSAQDSQWGPSADEREFWMIQDPFWAPMEFRRLNSTSQHVPWSIVWRVEWPLGGRVIKTNLGVLTASWGDSNPRISTSALWLLALHDLSDGHLIWAKPVTYQPSLGNVDFLGVFGEMALIDAIDHICCLSIATGACVWRHPVVAHHSSSLIFNARTKEPIIAVRLLSGSTNELICLSPSDGKTTFRARLTGPVESLPHGPLLWVDGDKTVTIERYSTHVSDELPAHRIMVYSTP